MIPVCSSDYFPNSHLILPTTNQQGARERECGSCSHRAVRRGEDRMRKKGGMERIKKKTQTDRQTANT